MQNNEKKNWWVRSRDRVRNRGVNRDRVRAGDERVILFEKHPHPEQKSGQVN